MGSYYYCGAISPVSNVNRLAIFYGYTYSLNYKQLQKTIILLYLFTLVEHGCFYFFWNWNRRLYTYSGMVIPLLYTISMGTKYILVYTQFCNFDRGCGGLSISVGIRNIQKPLLFVLVLMLCRLSGLIFIPHAIIIISICLDLGIGALFSLSLIVTLNHAHTVVKQNSYYSLFKTGVILLPPLFL